MKILYILRPPQKASLSRAFNVRFRGLTDGQGGFFEASLFEAGKVDPIPLADALKFRSRDLARYNALVVNSKCGVDWANVPFELKQLLSTSDVTTAVFLTGAHPSGMLSDEHVDLFDVVFKREPYADLDRYDISPKNRGKIVPTHLSNPFKRLSTKYPSRNRADNMRKFAWQVPNKYEVSFLGSDSNRKKGERIALWKRVVDEGFSTFGGIIPIEGSEVPARLSATKIGRPDYIKEIFRSAINLAPAGHGPFTYRHLELFWAGAFVLSNGLIREQWLRSPLIENQDYVAYDDFDEMVDKIRYYLARDEERHTISRNGRSAYEALHDVPAHAEEIRAALTSGAPAKP